MSPELSQKLTEPHNFMTIVAMNDRGNTNWSKTWNDASIWVGTDKTFLSTALTMTECLFSLNDNFLMTLPTHCQQIASDVIAFRRDSLLTALTALSPPRFALAVSELRVYQCGLLTGVPGLTVTWSVEHTMATETNSPAVLLTNNDARSPNIDRKAYTDSSHTPATYESCYKADCTSAGCTHT